MKKLLYFLFHRSVIVAVALLTGRKAHWVKGTPVAWMVDTTDLDADPTVAEEEMAEEPLLEDLFLEEMPAEEDVAEDIAPEESEENAE